MTTVAKVSTDLVPPVRLGRLLRERRQRQGWALAELAALHGVDEAELDALEAGVRVLDDATMHLVIDVYGVEHGAIVPQRSELVIDVDEGTISTAEHRVGIGSVTGSEQLLTRYLALVYALRGLPLGTPLTFRELDVDVLGRALAADPLDVQDRLRVLADDIRPPLVTTSTRIRRATVVPLAGLLVGLSAVGGLVIVQRRVEAPHQHEPVPADRHGLTLPVVTVPEPPSGPHDPSTDGDRLTLAETLVGDAAVISRPSTDQRDATDEEGVDIGTAVVIERPATPD